MVVIVFGSGGQLGKAIQSISTSSSINFHFFDSKQVDITKLVDVESVFLRLRPDFCVNAAAYTAVDQAEVEQDKAELVNRLGVLNIAQSCVKHNTTLVHISTDFVFDGEKNEPYLETDPTNPQGAYGRTKREGELGIVHSMKKYFIIRTSWLYSEYGHNFKKTMLRLVREKESLSVVNDQIGSPTNAIDLAEAILVIANSKSANFGIYHYSNQGSTSWYGFAKKIFEVIPFWDTML